MRSICAAFLRPRRLARLARPICAAFFGAGPIRLFRAPPSARLCADFSFSRRAFFSFGASLANRLNARAFLFLARRRALSASVSPGALDSTCRNAGPVAFPGASARKGTKRPGGPAAWGSRAHLPPDPAGSAPPKNPTDQQRMFQSDGSRPSTSTIRCRCNCRSSSAQEPHPYLATSAARAEAHRSLIELREPPSSGWPHRICAKLRTRRLFAYSPDSATTVANRKAGAKLGPSAEYKKVPKEGGRFPARRPPAWPGSPSPLPVRQAIPVARRDLAALLTARHGAARPALRIRRIRRFLRIL